MRRITKWREEIMGRFQGLTVLVTGAAGGLGQRMAQRFADEGARLVLSDLELEPLKYLADSLNAESVIKAGDIADESLSKSLVQLAIEQFGRLDIAVNNAGVAQGFLKLPHIPSEAARRIIDVNLLGVFYALKHQLPIMEKQNRTSARGGAIINIASVFGIAGGPRLSVYSASKHGVIGLTKSAAAEYARKGIRVNAVCPSFARTKMLSDFFRLDGKEQVEFAAELTRGGPMKRWAEIDEVVEVILFAADPKNSFMTGSSLSVDGGISAV
jgi:NAD(P)-dependent dehydrogenase (short-subunit alcohol dehydrogenase family)